MISPAQRAEIRRLYYAEHWPVGTIAAQLGVHHETVAVALNRASVLTRGGRCRSTALDPFLPFLRDTLTQYPRLRATRLHEMLRQRGYPGSAVQVRRVVRRLRPTPATEAFLRLTTLPGEVAQVDWGSFGTIRIGRGVRPLSAFVMVLGYSRAIHAVFTLDPAARNLLTNRHLKPEVARHQGVTETGCLVFDSFRAHQLSPSLLGILRSLGSPSPAVLAGCGD